MEGPTEYDTDGNPIQIPKHRWICMLSTNEWVSQQFRIGVSWPQVEQEPLVAEEIRKDKLRACYFCGETYKWSDPDDVSYRHECKFHANKFNPEAGVKLLYFPPRETGAEENVEGPPEERLISVEYGRRMREMQSMLTQWGPRKQKDAIWSCCFGGLHSAGCFERSHRENVDSVDEGVLLYFSIMFDILYVYLD